MATTSSGTEYDNQWRSWRDALIGGGKRDTLDDGDDVAKPTASLAEGDDFIYSKGALTALMAAAANTILWSRPFSVE
jgi:hypothetical protein